MRSAWSLFLSRLACSFCAAGVIGACSKGEAIGVDQSSDTGASGYCRTTTCPFPKGYPTAEGQCEPANWSDSDTCRQAGESNAPLWWRTACVGYDLNAAAGSGLSYADFSAAADGAFSAWTNATCPSTTSDTRVSIDVRDLGPVTCAKAEYDETGPNQNVIVFHDDAWPYEAADVAATDTPKSLTIALTTVSYDKETGELLDADIELNSADYTFTTSAAATGELGESFDLQSVLTHETGHFLGLAHSPLTRAVMNASGDTDSGGTKRALALEDVLGICSIYTASGERNVSTLAASSGTLAEGSCDPTPHGGFSSTCN